MQGLKLWLSPMGAAIAAVGFFLPWFHIGCQPIRSRPPVVTIQITGLQLATGQKPAQVDEFFKSFLFRWSVKPILAKYEAKTGQKLKLFAQRWLLWGVLISLLLALFLGISILRHGPTTGKKISGVLATCASLLFLVAGLLQHAPTRSGSTRRGGSFQIPETISYGLGPGGMMLLGGIFLAMVGFWWVKGRPETQTQSKEPSPT